MTAGRPDPGDAVGAADPRAVPGSRGAARERAVELLYEADVLQARVDTVLARHERDVPPLDRYTTELASGVAGRQGELDGMIRAAAEHWRLERMPPVDRSVLRLGCYELLARPEIPTAVVLNEAVRIAKLLSTADSGRFVNGVLGSIAREVRPAAG